MSPNGQNPLEAESPASELRNNLDSNFFLVNSFQRLQAISKDGGNPHFSNLLKNDSLKESLGQSL